MIYISGALARLKDNRQVNRRRGSGWHNGQLTHLDVEHLGVLHLLI